MDTLNLRNKIIDRFNYLIQDDSILAVLEGVFDSINTVDGTSLVPEDHYQIVQERRNKYYAGETDGAAWKEVKQRLKKKHGL